MGSEETILEQIQLSDITKSAGKEPADFFIQEDKPEDLEVLSPLQNFLPESDYNTPKSPKGRCRANIAAIELLKVLETEERTATAIEKNILSQYVGWGGTPQVFDPNKKEYEIEYSKVKALLTNSEYDSARASTTSAFYTNPFVVKSIYQALSSFGFGGGKLLDPSAGTGRFFSYMPKEMMEKSELHGVELDSITGEIAKQLYPGADIKIQGFEDCDFADNAFDVVVSNIPFGNFKIADDRYTEKFLIHDYFFAKALDKVRAGGIIAFVTSKGILDKAGIGTRQYIAARADLIGAIRLPTTTFHDTDVTTDIIFLQKRAGISTDEPDWIYTSKLENGVPINNYYIDNPHMLLGEMQFDSSMYGSETLTALHPWKDKDLAQLLAEAVKNLKADYVDASTREDAKAACLPADPHIRNYTYTVVVDEIYYRENSIMVLKKLPLKTGKRIKGLDSIRTALLELIELQKQNAGNKLLSDAQKKLGNLYDEFVKHYGYIGSKENQRAFFDDNDCNLLSSLESKGENDTVLKADIFFKRTIKPKSEVAKAATAIDALLLSLNHRKGVDLAYMSSLYEKSIDVIIKELEGYIFCNPALYIPENHLAGWETKEEYLSGNVRQKLNIAKLQNELYPDVFSLNVKALMENQPIDVGAGDIDVRLGATWVDEKYINQFIYELLDTPDYLRLKESHLSDEAVKVSYNMRIGDWNITNKSKDWGMGANKAYGTGRKNAYQIIEDTLNLRTVTVKDRVDDGTKVRYEYNHKESVLAREKQTLIKNAFRDWIFSDTERRDYLVLKYNTTFNNLNLREYDGSYLTLPDLNPNINLYPHQKDAIARIRVGQNTLLAHVVGAGKSFTMICGAKEQLRLGIASKVAFVVPNHLIQQMTSDIYYLYPDTKVLAATERDFSLKNRQRFLSKIALSDVEIVVMGHSQFEKLSMSDEYREEQIRNDIFDISNALEELQSQKGENYSIKQMEMLKRNLQAELKSLTDNSKKDSHITFEQLGIHSLFVDEAHYFKNGAIFSKMNNVAGVSSTRAKKATDMLMKCRYIHENGGSITFATGTPISNSMCELYVMQRYLQNDMLLENGMRHFDEWAANFGETVTAFELAPEGNAYRSKTRFSKFFNIPELLQLFKTVADIKMADVLDLPIPKIASGKPIIVTSSPSSELEWFMKESLPRVERIRNGSVKPYEDNMLKFTGDAKKAGLDMRLIDKDAENDPDGKISKCAELIYKHYIESMDSKGTQIVFCDTSTPKPNEWNVYDELKQQAVARGIPENEIAFIHDAKHDEDKKVLFAKCCSGEIRVLVGSTQKCGAGTNIQDRLIALHHLDCPYRPSDIEQREGRILRQGNKNEEVFLYRYVTERSFDAYLWSIISNKAKFISQIMNSKSILERTCEDIDEAVLNYAEVQAIASGNPLIKEKIEVDNETNRLQMLKSGYLNQRYQLQDEIDKRIPEQIHKCNFIISNAKRDIQSRTSKVLGENFHVHFNNSDLDSRDKAGLIITMLLSKCSKNDTIETSIGDYRGFRLYAYRDSWGTPYVNVQGTGSYPVEINMETTGGNIIRIDNCIDGLEETLGRAENNLSSYKKSLKEAQQELEKTFVHEEDLIRLIGRQAELIKILDISAKDESSEESTAVEVGITDELAEQDYESEDDEDLEL